MRSSLLLTVLSFAMALVVMAALAETNTTDGLKTVTVADLAALRASGKVVVVDANGTDTRARYGVIPDAVLLTRYDGYDVARELPGDHARKLVFYCASERCMASHKAAQRAIDAGYVDVNVLPAGIMGWKDAGQPTRAM